MNEKLSTAELMRRARLASGLNPDKRKATAEEVSRARAIKDRATTGTEEHDMREARLAEIEDRRPRIGVRL